MPAICLIKKAFSVIALFFLFMLADSCRGPKKIIIPPPPPVILDADNDGVPDQNDKCPAVAGLASMQGCPDRDGDGIADAEDKCPGVAGLARYQGCPVPDTDKDGVADDVDKCPAVPGYARYNGCPIPDTDADGINDEEDKCLTEKGPPSNNGCPVIVDSMQAVPVKDSVKRRPTAGRKPASNAHGTDEGVEAVDSSGSQTNPAGSLPKASIAYSFRSTMKKGETREIRMKVQLERKLEEVARELIDRLNQDERQAKASGSNDTSIVKTLQLAGYKYFKVIPKYNKKIFSVEPRTDSIQPLDSMKPTNWLWMVTALKPTEKEIITLHVTGIDENNREHYLDDGDIPITVIVTKKPFPLAWLIAGILFILLLAALILWLMARRKARRKQIFFSYNWGHAALKAIVDDLYICLKKAGFNVVKDKDDLKYGGSIINFMADLSRAKLVIVAVSERYLKSVNCMKELFHIYSNAGMNKEAFQRRILPITTEQLNLSNLDVIKSYEDHWIAQEQKWQDYTRENSNTVTKEEAEEYEFTRRVANEITNILTYLYDINAMSIEALKENDFEKVKMAIREALDGNA